MSQKIVVMKFGGTSVATKDGRDALVARVAHMVEQGLSPVVVVSAMGRAGDPYATDTLLALTGEGECSPHEKDVLMSVGETISSIVVASALRERGVDAAALSGADAGIVTTPDEGEARIKEIHTGYIMSLIERGIVPVVAGFQGIDEQGRIMTLGRGGSDTTACALGVALQAVSVDVYKDVDGIMTSDPRAVADASVLEQVSADELFEMATTGAKIVHAPAAELALMSGIAMRVRNTFTDAPGTAIVDIAAYKPRGIATAVTRIAGIARIRIKLPYAKTDARAHMNMQTTIFNLMADSQVSLDMFTPMNDRLVFAVNAKDLERAGGLLAREGYDYAVRNNLSKVTLVGAGMHGVPGVMARVAHCLQEAEVDILQIADSHTTISVLVLDECANRAILALHSEFDL